MASPDVCQQDTAGNCSHCVGSFLPQGSASLASRRADSFLDRAARLFGIRSLRPGLDAHSGVHRERIGSAVNAAEFCAGHHQEGFQGDESCIWSISDRLSQIYDQC